MDGKKLSKKQKIKKYNEEALATLEESKRFIEKMQIAEAKKPLEKINEEAIRQISEPEKMQGRKINLDALHENEKKENEEKDEDEKDKKKKIQIEYDIKQLYAEAASMIDEELINEVRKLEKDNKLEPLLADNPDIFFIGDIPNVFAEIEELYLRQRKAYWTEDDVSMDADKNEWENILYDQTSLALTEEQRKINTEKNNRARYFIKLTLAFFANSDGIVNSNLVSRLSVEIKNPYSQLYYGFQVMIEGIHNRAYTKMIQALISDPVERDELFHAIYNIPVIRKKALFALKYISHPDNDHYINSPKSIGLRLLAQGCMELINFSSSFASIYWIRSRGKMTGLSEFNKQIAADEGLHGEASAAHYRLLKNKLPEHIAHKVIKESYAVEEEFFKHALPVEMIGMNSDDMAQYVKMQCNRLSEMFGYSLVFPDVTKIPSNFSFVEKINLNSKTNFHEYTPVEYQQAMIKNAKTWGARFNF